MNTLDNMNPIDIGLCVCGKRIIATTDPCGVAHEDPECETFRQMEPQDFVSYIKAVREFGAGHVNPIGGTQ